MSDSSTSEDGSHSVSHSNVTSPREEPAPATGEATVTSPGRRVIKKRVRRRKKPGATPRGSAVRKSRSSSVSMVEVDGVAGGRPASEAAEQGNTSTPDEQDVVSSPVGKPSYHAHQCPSCQQAFADSKDLTRHLETHQESPFPGIKVRHRGSILDLSRTNGVAAAHSSNGGGGGGGEGGGSESGSNLVGDTAAPVAMDSNNNTKKKMNAVSKNGEEERKPQSSIPVVAPASAQPPIVFPPISAYLRMDYFNW